MRHAEFDPGQLQGEERDWWTRWQRRADEARAAVFGGRQVSHPGYFWLAFDWRNILPSCVLCNTAGGKGTEFPLEEGGAYGFVRRTSAISDTATDPWVYPDAPELDLEERPLLLHPYRDDPSSELEFREFGAISASTQRGAVTIEVYKLRSDRLRKARQRAQENAWRQVAAARIADRSIAKRQQASDRAIAAYESGSAPFSAACIAHIRMNDEALGVRRVAADAVGSSSEHSATRRSTCSSAAGRRRSAGGRPLVAGSGLAAERARQSARPPAGAQRRRAAMKSRDEVVS